MGKVPYRGRMMLQTSIPFEWGSKKKKTDPVPDLTDITCLQHVTQEVPPHRNPQDNRAPSHSANKTKYKDTRAMPVTAEMGQIQGKTAKLQKFPSGLQLDVKPPFHPSANSRERRERGEGTKCGISAKETKPRIPAGFPS